MSKKISIAIDAMGGDNSPDKIIQGINFFLKQNYSKDDFILNIFGKKHQIDDQLKNYKIESSSINIIPSDKVISDQVSPMTAVKY